MKSSALHQQIVRNYHSFNLLWLMVLIYIALRHTAILHAEKTSTPPLSSTDFDATSDTRQTNKQQPAYQLDNVIVHGKQVPETERTTSFAETIDVSKNSESVSTLAEILSQSVSVQTRNLGGLGAYAAASIRGSTSLQIPIYLDGTLLNAGGFPSVNIGDLNLDTLATVDIYRGITPVFLGTGGIGGAISLKTHSLNKTTSQVALSVGSFHTARLMALHNRRIGKFNAFIIFSTQGSQGDFTYLNRNGTLYNNSDDHFQKRQNNHHLEFSNVIKLQTTAGFWKLQFTNNFNTKWQGVPGIDSVPTEHAKLHNSRESLSFHGERQYSTALHLKMGISYLGLHENFDDSYNEIGIGYQHKVTMSHTIGGFITATLWPVIKHRTHIRFDTYCDRLSAEDILQHTTNPSSYGIRNGVAIQHQWHPNTILHLEPAIRLEHHYANYTHTAVITALEPMQQQSFNALFWSPSIGIAIQIFPQFTLQANSGRYARIPDLAELFGDSGSIIGNPDLTSEIGINTDLGFSYQLKNRGIFSLLRLSMAGFHSIITNLIAYVQNSQNTIRPENIDSAQILGTENSLYAYLASIISLKLNYTYLHGINLSQKPYHHGKQIPGRPQHEAYGKIEFTHSFGNWSPSLWFDVDYASNNYLDLANIKEDALARLFFNTGIKLRRPQAGLTATIEIKNILDTIATRDSYGRLRPMRDYEAFPLPGRSIFATIHWNINTNQER